MAYLCSLEVHSGIHPGSHLTAEITRLNVFIQSLGGIGNKRRVYSIDCRLFSRTPSGHRTCGQTFELYEAGPATQP